MGGSGLDGGGGLGIFDFGDGIAIDSSGNAYVTGDTDSSNFLTTRGRLPEHHRRKLRCLCNQAGSALVCSTYLGGSGAEAGHGVAVDALGNACVTGFTSSSDFPMTSGAFQTSSRGPSNVFVTKLNAAGSALVYSTYLGGSGSCLGFGDEGP